MIRYDIDVEFQAEVVTLYVNKTKRHAAFVNQEHTSLHVLMFWSERYFHALVYRLDFIPIDFADIGGLVPIDTNILDLRK